MGAKKIEPVIWKPEDIGLDVANLGESERKTAIQRLSQPEHEGQCEIVEGETAEEMAVNLAGKLREAKLI